MAVLLDTDVEGMPMRDRVAKTIKGAEARQAYELWLDRGIYMANHICATSRKVYSFGMEMDF